MRQVSPAHPSMVLMRPDFGDPRIDQATPATSGGTNSGIRLTAATKPLHGVLVRTTIQEKVSPITTASAVPPVQPSRVSSPADHNQPATMPSRAPRSVFAAGAASAATSAVTLSLRRPPAPRLR